MRRGMWTALLWISTLGVGEPATAEEALLPAVADAHLRSSPGNRNEGTLPVLEVRHGNVHRAVVRFDLGALPHPAASIRLTSATLELFVERTSGAWNQVGATVDAHRLGTAWTETGATWNCPADTNPTNNHLDCAAPWSGGSFEATPTARTTINRQTSGWVSWDVTADVAAMLAGGANHGWLLKKSHESASGAVEFTAREGSAASRPRLRLVYELATSDTEPPQIDLTPWAEGSALAEASPELGVFFSDGESGIAPGSIAVLVDGVARTAEGTLAQADLLVFEHLALTEGPHEIVARVRDLAGNTGEDRLHLTIDTQPPLIALTAPSPGELVNVTEFPIRLEHTDLGAGLDPDSLFLRVGGGEVEGCASTATATTCTGRRTFGGTFEVLAEVRDLAGNAATASVPVSLLLDRNAPELTLELPGGLVVSGREPVAARLTFSDGESAPDVGTLRLELDGVSVLSSCTLEPGVALCTLEGLGRGAHLLAARLADRVGNAASTEQAFTVVVPVAVSITSPASGAVIAASTIDITGTVDEAAVAVEVNGVEASVSGGAFTVPNFPVHEGEPLLVAVARDAAGNTGMASVRIVADATPPTVGFATPVPGVQLAAGAITVTGRVNDPTVGLVREQAVAVSVNGVPASVANGTFRAAGVTLVPGRNTLTALATDSAGNRGTATLEVFAEDLRGLPRVEVTSGDGQTGEVRVPLAAPLAVTVRDAAGLPLGGARVIFRVAMGDGSLVPVGGAPEGKRLLLVTADAAGRASASFTLGSRAGVASNRVAVTAVGVIGEANFFATARPGPPSMVHVHSGDMQRGLVGAPLALPLVAVAMDAAGNTLANVPVEFSVVRGNGTVAGASTVSVLTNANGLASVAFTLGEVPGYDGHVVEASMAGLASLPATFRASAFVPGDPAATAVSGVVLDGQGDPVPGVTMTIHGTALRTTTAADGTFRLTGAPVGRALLHADATTATRPGTWASLEFELVLVPGIDNSMGRPIYILPLAIDRGVFVDETHGGTVTLADLPGFALEVAPGSVTFPGDGREGVVSVTAVHADKIPMAPNAGMQPRLIVTIQPAGAKFDPPARMTMPNVDGLAPGAVSDLFSFDHDLGAFVSIGPGTVTEDGLLLRSDPGFGVLEAGWHCGAPSGEGGSSATLHVEIGGGPVILLLNEPVTTARASSGSKLVDEPGRMVAAGSPARDGSYTWESLDPSIFTLNPSGAGLCPDRPSCPTVAGPVSPGTGIAKVIYECGVTDQKKEDTHPVVVTKVRLSEVSFHGNRTVVMDGTTLPYEAPHWQDNTDPPDGDADDPPAIPGTPGGEDDDRDFPVAYVAGEAIRISARLKSEPHLPAGTQVWVRANAGVEHSYPAVLVTVEEAGLIPAPEQALRDAAPNADASPPPAKPVNFLDPLKLKWEVSLDQENWLSAGETKNRVYLTLKEPRAQTLWESLLDIACRNAKGKNTAEDAVAAIWSDFENPIPGVKRKPKDGFNRQDGREMHYWVNEDDPRLGAAVTRCQTQRGMMLFSPSPPSSNEPDLRDIGTCNSWAHLLINVLRAVGIDDASLVRVDSKEANLRGAEWESKPNFPIVGDRTKGLIIVKNWDKPTAGAGFNNSGFCGSYPYLFSTGAEKSDWREQPGAAGQGTADPISLFFEHFIVEWGGHFYDPSYGVSSSGTSGDRKKQQKAWESDAIAGVAILCLRGIAVATAELPSSLETKLETVATSE